MIQWVFILLTLALIGWMIKILVVDKESIEANEYNPMNEIRQIQVVRGSILDMNGIPLAFTETLEDGTEVRRYPYGMAAAHTVGYIGRGKAGLEAALDDVLLSPPGFVDQLNSWANEEKVKGANVITTLDAELTQYIYNLFEGYRGAVVVTEPKTGRIRALVSSPSYDPQTLIDDWDEVASRDDSPLYSRATMGLYPPGSTFKILTALAMYRNMPDYENFEYFCTSALVLGDQVITCHNNAYHGDLFLESAFAYSCNGFFGMAGIEMGGQILRETAEYVKLGNDFGFILPQSVSSVQVTDQESDSMLARTAIGQGDTLMTPFQLNMLTCAIANQGVLVAPTLLDKTVDADGNILSEEQPKLWGTIMTRSEASFLENLMRAVVTYGTATNLNTSRYECYGKSGTAQVDGLEDHSWFTCYVKNTQGQVEYAITVLIEEGGSWKRAVPMTEAILDYLYPY